MPLVKKPDDKMADDRDVIGEKPLIAQPEKYPKRRRTLSLNKDSQHLNKQVFFQKNVNANNNHNDRRRQISTLLFQNVGDRSGRRQF